MPINLFFQSVICVSGTGRETSCTVLASLSRAIANSRMTLGDSDSVPKI